jgi:hypothetical protein
MSVAQCFIALAGEFWTIYALERRSSTRQALLSGASHDSAVDCVAEIADANSPNTKAHGKAL